MSFTSKRTTVSSRTEHCTQNSEYSASLINVGQYLTSFPLMVSFNFVNCSHCPLFEQNPLSRLCNRSRKWVNFNIFFSKCTVPWRPTWHRQVYRKKFWKCIKTQNIEIWRWQQLFISILCYIFYIFFFNKKKEKLVFLYMHKYTLFLLLWTQLSFRYVSSIIWKLHCFAAIIHMFFLKNNESHYVQKQCSRIV